MQFKGGLFYLMWQRYIFLLRLIVYVRERFAQKLSLLILALFSAPLSIFFFFHISHTTGQELSLSQLIQDTENGPCWKNRGIKLCIAKILVSFAWLYHWVIHLSHELCVQKIYQPTNLLFHQCNMNQNFHMMSFFQETTFIFFFYPSLKTFSPIHYFC